jgi:hypothetical protein
MRVGALWAAVLIAAFSSTVDAQARVGKDSVTRLMRFGRDVVYGTAEGLAFAGVDQLREEPAEWGTGWGGFKKRAASNIGEFLIQEGVTEGLAAAMNRPLDYTRCDCNDKGARVAWALAGAVTDRMRDGTRKFAVPRVVGAFAGSFAQASWRPDTENRTNTALVNGAVSLGIGALINLYREFR